MKGGTKREEWRRRRPAEEEEVHAGVMTAVFAASGTGNKCAWRFNERTDNLKLLDAQAKRALSLEVH